MGIISYLLKEGRGAFFKSLISCKANIRPEDAALQNLCDLPNVLHSCTVFNAYQVYNIERESKVNEVHHLALKHRCFKPLLVYEIMENKLFSNKLRVERSFLKPQQLQESANSCATCSSFLFTERKVHKAAGSIAQFSED